MKERTKRNVIWSIPLNEFKESCQKARTLRNIIPNGMRVDGRNTHVVKQRIKKENIDISHIPLGKSANKNRKMPRKNNIPLEEYLIENSSHSRNTIKRRLLAEGFFENKCAICELEGTWNEKPIVMILDHINGINDDYRLENLRMVCPNCNSQLDTFGSKNWKNLKRKN